MKLTLSSQQVDLLFPYFVSVNLSFNVSSVGSKLESLLNHTSCPSRSSNSNTISNHIKEYFLCPNFDWEWKEILEFVRQDTIVTLKLIYDPRIVLEGRIIILDPQNDPSISQFQAIFLCNIFTQKEIDLKFENDKFQKSNKELQKSLETKREYVRYVSHEIRTPLNVVMMGLKLLENSLISSGDLKGSTEENPPENLDLELVKDIQNSAIVSVSILNDLLFYEKIESNLFNVELLETKFLDVLFPVLQMFKVQAKSQKVKMIWDLVEMNGLYGMIDITKFSQVIRNLLSNALKFSPEYGEVRIFAEIKFDEAQKKRKFSSTSKPSLEVDSGNMNNNPISVSCKSDVASSLNSLSFVKNSVRNSSRMSEDFNVGDDDDVSSLEIYNDLNFGSVFSEATTIETLLDAAPKLRISVSDSGCGITKEDQASLFKEFSQIKPGQNQGGGGSGLGLWVAKNIVEGHGGTISVFSNGENKGSTFFIEIPITRQDDYDSTPLISEHHSFLKRQGTPALILSKSSSHDLSKLENSTDSSCVKDEPKGRKPDILFGSILLVDDDVLVRKMTRKSLDGKCLLIEEASNGQDAVTKCLKRMKDTGAGYDVVMMDSHMPVLRGPDAVRELRSLGYSGLVIGATGDSDHADLDAFRRDGCDFVMVKPIDIKTFIDMAITCSKRSNTH